MLLAKILLASCLVWLSAAANAADPAPDDVALLLIPPHDDVTLRSLSLITDDLQEATGVRIMPVIGEGSWQSVHDLGQLSYVNLAVIGRSVLQYVDDSGGAAPSSIVPIATLGHVVAHVVTTKDVETIGDLQGKRVSFGDRQDNFVAAGVLFDRLEVTVEALALPQNDALAALLDKEIDAAVLFGGVPIAGLQDLPWDSNLHLLALPELVDDSDFEPHPIRHDDYENLIVFGQSTPTLRMPLDLVTNIPEGRSPSVSGVLDKLVGALKANILDWKLQSKNRSVWRDVTILARD